MLLSSVGSLLLCIQLYLFFPVFWHRFVYKLGWILDYIKKLQQKQKRWIIISTESLGFITDERNVDKILVIKIYSHEIQYELWA